MGLMPRLIVLMLFWCGAIARGQETPLAKEVRRILAEPSMRNVDAGVVIKRLGQVREQDVTLASIRENESFIPASNLKLLTTAAAVRRLGADFRFQTALLADGTDLAVIGDGDPTLGDSEFLRGTGWTMLTVFESWAAELKRNRITQVRSLRIDDSIFDGVMFHPNWPVDQAHKAYVPEVAGLNFNANCLDVFLSTRGGAVNFRVEPELPSVSVNNTAVVADTHALWLSRELGSNRIVLRGTVNGSNKLPFRVTLSDPPMRAGEALAGVLRRAGISVGEVIRDRTIRRQLDALRPDATDAEVEGSARDPRQPEASRAGPAGSKITWRPIARHETPLAAVLNQTNKESTNLYAEALCKRIAATPAAGGDWKSGTAMLKAVAAEASGGASAFEPDDGSGLSKVNRATPAGFVDVLSMMFHSPDRDMYVASMSVGGVDGTLDNRFRDDLRGRVLAKSGSVSGVSTLSGYVRARSGEWFAFSILMNRVERGAAQPAQDAIVRAIDRLAD
jgi:serine-type D-Ala-D-Ala carboxypeptidase/endopeptidase (penicillin-binding protein 4)